jgi:hypothetical protein
LINLLGSICEDAFYAELNFSIVFLTRPIYFKIKNFPILKPHYADENEPVNKFIEAKVNYAIIIGLSEYASLGDYKFLDLK